MSGIKKDKDLDEINLRTLKRMDPNVINIIKSASAVAVYEFSSQNYAWRKKEIQGSLHVVNRSISPHTFFCVINRLNTYNLMEPVTKDADIKIESPFLLFKSRNNDIYCIWFYDDDECKEIGEFLTSKLSSLSGNLPSTSSATASLVDTLSQLGIKNITVASNANSNLSDSKNAKTEKPSSSLNVPITPTNHKISENGGRSVNLQDLFATASIGQISRPGFGPISLINKLDSAVQQIEDSKEKKDFEKNNSTFEEMLTPAMIDEKAKSKAQEEDKKLLISPVNLTSHQNENLFNQNTPSSGFTVPYSRTSTSSHQNNQSKSKSISIEHLKNCLIHLIQNDDDFIRKIHSAYLLSSSSP